MISIFAVILNMHKRLESIISTMPAEKDMAVTADWNGLNTGVFVLRNSTWSSEFLRAAWAQNKELTSKRTADNRPLPFLYEQRAFHLLIDSDVWRRRGLPTWRGKPSIEDNRQHVWYLPQCSMNSYSLHPLDRRGDHQVTQYIPGDLLVHFAGKKGRKRVNLMEYYLDVSEKGK